MSELKQLLCLFFGGEIHKSFRSKEPVSSSAAGNTQRASGYRREHMASLHSVSEHRLLWKPGHLLRLTIHLRVLLCASASFPQLGLLVCPQLFSFFLNKSCPRDIKEPSLVPQAILVILKVMWVGVAFLHW